VLAVLDIKADQITREPQENISMYNENCFLSP